MKNNISYPKRNIFVFGIASILFSKIGLRDVLAKPNFTTLQSQMMPQQGMMNQGMMRGKKIEILLK